MTVLSDDESDYALLRDRIIEQLNPRDDDVSEVSIMLDAVTTAAEFIASCPCSCVWDDEYSEYGERCARCVAIGRAGDRRLDP